MKAEREWLDPAKRSILAKTSPDSVIDVFSFILPIYHPRRIHASTVAAISELLIWLATLLREVVDFKAGQDCDEGQALVLSAPAKSFAQKYRCSPSWIMRF